MYNTEIKKPFSHLYQPWFEIVINYDIVSTAENIDTNQIIICNNHKILIINHKFFFEINHKMFTKNFKKKHVSKG